MFTIFGPQSLNLSKLILLYKVWKAAKHVITDCIILNPINEKLAAANSYKQNWVNQIGIQTNSQRFKVLG